MATRLRIRDIPAWLLRAWWAHLLNCRVLFTTRHKGRWLADNLESVAVLILTVMGALIVFWAWGEHAEDYVVPRMRSGRVQI